jgi:hypothetical protein
MERRTLVDGMRRGAVDPQKEQEFISGAKASTGSVMISTAPTPIAKAPLSTRIRADFAAALKRASLERQLKGVEPNTLQDILEEAIEPWLKTNGYLQ